MNQNITPTVDPSAGGVAKLSDEPAKGFGNGISTTVARQSHHLAHHLNDTVQHIAVCTPAAPYG